MVMRIDDRQSWFENRFFVAAQANPGEAPGSLARPSVVVPTLVAPTRRPRRRRAQKIRVDSLVTSVAEWDEELLQFTSGWVRHEGQTVVAADRRFHRRYNRDTVTVFNDEKVRLWEIETTCRSWGN